MRRPCSAHLHEDDTPGHGPFTAPGGPVGAPAHMHSPVVGERHAPRVSSAAAGHGGKNALTGYSMRSVLGGVQSRRNVTKIVEHPKVRPRRPTDALRAGTAQPERAPSLVPLPSPARHGWQLLLCGRRLVVCLLSRP
jgi:hypothetical protein